MQWKKESFTLAWTRCFNTALFSSAFFFFSLSSSVKSILLFPKAFQTREDSAPREEELFHYATGLQLCDMKIYRGCSTAFKPFDISVCVAGNAISQ